MTSIWSGTAPGSGGFSLWWLGKNSFRTTTPYRDATLSRSPAPGDLAGLVTGNAAGSSNPHEREVAFPWNCLFFNVHGNRHGGDAELRHQRHLLVAQTLPLGAIAR